jgi:hypothetical protein
MINQRGLGSTGVRSHFGQSKVRLFTHSILTEKYCSGGSELLLRFLLAHCPVNNCLLREVHVQFCVVIWRQ